MASVVPLRKSKRLFPSRCKSRRMLLLLFLAFWCCCTAVKAFHRLLLLPRRNNRKSTTMVGVVVSGTKVMAMKMQTNDDNKGASEEKDEGNDNDDDDDDDIDVDSVSEAEALLACRAYLQRKNRLGEWTKYEQRKQQAERLFPTMRQQQQQHPNVRSVDSTGFFWENPSQLKHLRHHPSINELRNLVKEDDDDSSVNNAIPNVRDIFTLFDDEDEEDDEKEENENMELVEDEIWETLNPRSALQREELYREAEEDDMLNEDSASTAFDDAPSESRIRRSEAAKRTWSDPEWRKKWYNKRWGHNNNNSKRRYPEKRRKQQLEERLRSIRPETFLSNEIVAAMTEEEIAEAIRSYITSAQRRSKSRKISLLERKSALRPSLTSPDKMKKVPRDTLLRDDPKAVEELRRQRSERARKAYEKRLENQAVTATAGEQTKKLGRKAPSTKKKKVASTMVKSTMNTPTGALVRIQTCLDNGQIPSADDVECILEPARLAGRKDTLRRILSECFNLRGKCIPVNFAEDKEEEEGAATAKSYMFATQAPISELGSFVLSKLRA